MERSTAIDPVVKFDRVSRRMTTAMFGANLAGGIAVVLLVTFVVSGPLGLREANDSVRLRDLLVFAAYAAVAGVIGTTWSRRRVQPLRRLLASGRPPTDEERTLALRSPLRQLEVNAILWGVGAVLFTGIDATVSWRLGLTTGISVLLGGALTCTLAYLLSERVGREAIVAALAGRPPSRPVRPGIVTRVALAALLGAGIPLIAIILIAWHVLSDRPIPPTRLATAVLVLAVVGLFINDIAVWLSARSLADPLNALRSALARLRAGDTSVSVDVYDGSEIGLLQSGFNEMVAGMREREQLEDLFGRHVGVEVARQALERGVEMGGETREVAVLFIDITGSTTLAATRAPAHVVDLLNRFFGVVIEVVTECGGWVNKFEGDAALCVFGAPIEDGQSAAHALTAARVLDERIAVELPELGVGIGVSFGEAVAGNVGAAERFEYTVIGDPVNEAARLSELAKGRRTALASMIVLEHAPFDEALLWQADGEVELRGRPLPTRLATPIAGHAARARGT